MTTRTDHLEQERIKRPGGYTCSPRMAWNSGFWDGVYDRLHHQPRRSREANIRPLPSWSPFYCAGYDVGTDAAIDGFKGERSTEYWQPWRDALNERDEAAMLRKEQGWK